MTGQGSNETLGPMMHTKRRRRKEQLEEDDSSDLSDDSDDDDDKRAVQQIKFTKMPVRNRSGSSPNVSSKLRDEVSVLLTSPSRPPESQGLRRGSQGAVDMIKQRARRDTATSSEMSSEDGIEPLMFRRQTVHARAVKQSQMLAGRIQEEELDAVDSDLDDEDVGEASDLSDGFGDAAESESLLGLGGPLIAVDTLDSSPRRPTASIPPPITPMNQSPKRSRPAPPALPRLPTGRPISYVQPVSLLSKAFKTKEQAPEDPFQRYAQLSGKGDPNPLWIKIYAPFSSEPSEPFQVPLRRMANEGVPVTVSELIGLGLWRYADEERQPELKDADMNINRWTLRMVEDEEVDYDFPACGRTRPVSDFTSNNNRPARGRARDKPWDEFALVRATDEQYQENEDLTPQFTQTESTLSVALPTPDVSQSQTALPMQRTNSDQPGAPSYIPNRNPITGPSFAPHALRKDSSLPLLDAPATSAPSSTPRSGIPKTVSIHYVEPNSLQTTLLSLPTTTDTYLAELFTTACQRLNADKALHVLKVRGTQTVAPQDRTVEALGERLHLDLVRRRFVGVGGLGGSPDSESPNAPLLLTTGTTPTRHKKKGGFGGVLATQQQQKSSVETSTTALYTGPGKRYQVIRRQPLSFAPSHPRILALDGEYVHIMPAAALANPLNPDAGAGGAGGIAGGAASGAGKTTSVHLSSVVGCKASRKHPKMVRVLVYREKETKRYDFEAGTREEAAEIAGEIRRGVERFAGEDG